MGADQPASAALSSRPRAEYFSARWPYGRTAPPIPHGLRVGGDRQPRLFARGDRQILPSAASLTRQIAPSGPCWSGGRPLMVRVTLQGHKPLHRELSGRRELFREEVRSIPTARARIWRHQGIVDDMTEMGKSRPMEDTRLRSHRRFGDIRWISGAITGEGTGGFAAHRGVRFAPNIASQKTQCSAHVRMTPLCQIGMTLPEHSWGDGHGGADHERSGAEQA
jgi:hypothetical protein